MVLMKIPYGSIMLNGNSFKTTINRTSLEGKKPRQNGLII